MHPAYFFSSDAPKNVEITAFKNADSVTVNAVVLDEESVSTPAAPFTVRVKMRAKAVRLLPDGEEIPFRQEGDYTVFTTRTLHIFDMYELIGSV